MGEHTEITVKEWHISQAEQDEIACQSHMNAHKATELGTLTAGNSSPLTDGAASVVWMSESRAAELGHEPLAFVRDFINVGIHPDDGLLMGPGIAVPRLLARNGLALADLDIIEMRRRDARLGLISVCGAGATAVAMLLERT